MARNKRRKTIKRENKVSGSEMYAGTGVAAAWMDNGGGWLYWPSLDERKEVTLWDRDVMIRKARALEANSGLAGAAIDNVVAYMGWLVPKADSDDLEWNKLADLAFLRRTSNPQLFDVAGELNWFSAQMWIERMRAIDGDNLTVLCSCPWDNGSMFSFHSAPQIRNGEGKSWMQGCLVNKNGWVSAYGLYDYDSDKVKSIPRRDAILYRHSTGGRMLRGYSDLRRAIVNLHDIAEIVGYTKKGVKLGSSVGLVETSDKEVKKGGARNNVVGKTEMIPNGDGTYRKIEKVMAGTSVVRLDPGADIKVLTDNRPSPNVMNLIQYLMDDIAYGIGLTPGLLWDPERVGSAGTRFLLGRLKRWLKIKMMYRAEWCRKVWTYTIAKEMKEGRLPYCKDKNWMDVEWIPLPDMTIDVVREGNLMISLVDAGLADQDLWWLSNYGMTYEDGMRRKVENYKKFEEMCAAAGVDPNKVVPGANRGGVANSSSVEVIDEDNQLKIEDSNSNEG